MAFLGGDPTLLQALLAPTLLDGSESDLAALRGKVMEAVGRIGRVGSARQLRSDKGSVTVATLIEGTKGARDLVMVLSDGPLSAGSILGIRLETVRPYQSRPMPEGQDPNDQPAPYVDAVRFARRELILGEDGSSRLPVTFDVPKTATPESRVPAVLLVWGDHTSDVDGTVGVSRPARDVAEALAANGVAVMRVTRRTVAHPARRDDPSLVIEGEIVNDLLDAVALLKAQREVAADRIFLLAQGEGTVAALLAAGKTADVHGLVLLAPPRILDAEAIVRRAEARHAAGIGTDVDVAAIRFAAERLASGNLSPNEKLAGLCPAYWERIAAIDPVSIGASFTGPLLVAFAGQDAWVGRDDAAAWGKALASRRRAVLRSYGPATHEFLRIAPTQAHADSRRQYVMPEVLRDVLAFLLDASGRTRPAGRSPKGS